MVVYIHGSILSEEYGDRLVAAEITAVHEHGVDLLIENGARCIDWRAKLYDQNENELPLETIRREFEREQAAKDPQARIAAIVAELAACDAAYAEGVQEA